MKNIKAIFVFGWNVFRQMKWPVKILLLAVIVSFFAAGAIVVTGQPGFTGYIKGKVNGLAQAVDCIVGRVGTKPNATVKDASCLRSECHSAAELVSTDFDYASIKFTHENHIEKKRFMG